MRKKIVSIVLISILVVAAFLRLWKLDKVPVSLFGDELDLGYQAYSILKTGKDYYGNAWPIHFHSLAEWRTPLYLYSAVPTVAAFGITPYGVRLPAAVFGFLGILALYLLVKELSGNEALSLISAVVLTFSPWHIQYSRAGFEVTEMLFFLLIGLWLFLKAVHAPPSGHEGKWLWVSAASLTLTPWVYSTAKLFTPILLVFLFIVYRKEIIKLKMKYLVYAVIALIVVGAPIAYSTLFGGGAQRFSYISIFSDPTIESEIGTARLEDAHARGETGTGLKPTAFDRLTDNKFTYVGNKFLRNYFQPFSSDFLFNNGDPNPRQSIHEMGELYKIEAIPLAVGVILFFVSKSYGTKEKMLISFLILAGVIPAALTTDGGNHATRLILILPSLVLLVAVGITDGLKLISAKYRKITVGLYLVLFAISFLFYQTNYWIHNPTQSERWWHTGYQESISYVKENQGKYDKVVITTSAEPPWIFFAGYYEYPPADWQKNFPIGNDVTVKGLGKVSHIGKFYFGSFEGGLYDWGKSLDNKTMYVASAKDVNVNLIMEPNRTPSDLILLKSIAYPSGEPAFYVFTGK